MYIEFYNPISQEEFSDKLILLIKQIKELGLDLELVIKDKDLTGINFSLADFKKMSFIRVNLEGANLEGTNLEETNLSGVNLSQTNLSGVNLYRAKLEISNLSSEIIANIIRNITRLKK